MCVLVVWGRVGVGGRGGLGGLGGSWGSIISLSWTRTHWKAIVALSASRLFRCQASNEQARRAPLASE